MVRPQLGLGLGLVHGKLEEEQQRQLVPELLLGQQQDELHCHEMAVVQHVLEQK